MTTVILSKPTINPANEIKTNVRNILRLGTKTGKTSTNKIALSIVNPLV